MATQTPGHMQPTLAYDRIDRNMKGHETRERLNYILVMFTDSGPKCLTVVKVNRISINSAFEFEQHQD